MKIGIVCYPTYGGSGVVATELGKGLARRGHEIHFITTRMPVRLDTYSDRVLYHEVRSADYPLFESAPYESALTSRLVDIARFEKLDLLHVHYAVPHASCAWMAKQILHDEGIDLPVITTLHGTDITLVGRDQTYSPVVTFSINHSDGVTAVSESLKRDTFKHFNVTRDIEVIHNFVDLERFKKTNKEHFRQLFVPDSAKVMIHTSNFRKVKRVQDVVKVFDIVNKQIPSRLLLVGDGPERQHIEQLCRSLDSCPNIRFLGKQEAVEELLAISDVFVLPSESESFGLAALEAMACEVPVISSNTGGLPEINIHGDTGYLYDVGDVEGMAAGALDILSSEERLLKFRKGAFAQANRFDIANILPRYEAYYASVLQNYQAHQTA